MSRKQPTIRAHNRAAAVVIRIAARRRLHWRMTVKIRDLSRGERCLWSSIILRAVFPNRKGNRERKRYAMLTTAETKTYG